MSDVVIVDAVRTPMGKRNGAFRETHPVKLGSRVVCELVNRLGLDPNQIDHVIFGCVSQAGEQTFNIARNIVLDAELPISIPATSVDFQCGSSQQAIHLAMGLIASGQMDIVIAGGVENMTRVPMGSSMMGQQPFTERIMENHNMIPQGIAADKIAKKWGITREQVDRIGYESHLKAAKATQNGWFKNEIVPMEGLDADGNRFMLDYDEGIRPNPNLEKMATLPVVFTEDGVTTAGNSSQITDGAAAVILMTAEKAAELGLKPRARIVSTVTVGSDPHLMLTGPIDATKKVLSRAGLTLGDVDLFEVNEAFAAVIGMWEKELNADMSKVNVHGGAIALGHPLGGSGARLMTTLINALEIHQKRYGLQTMCCGGGMGTGTIIERLS
ncbi:MAG: acetyl-CoA C-acyltransferase [Phototrophicales bacterium]|nr:MAG: acetyl-CoA C-acyltransferase [Phototrophicales bacterium]RMG70838.1 MAG: thiolase family protein [Chloroflexota bacterium]